MSIQHWPIRERPREKLVSQGSVALSDSELLAILLGHGCSRLNAVALARQLLNTYGGIRQICDASKNDICQQYGIGLAAFSRIQATLELGRRYLFETISRGDAFENPAVTRRFLLSKLRHQHREVFGVLFLDNAHRVIAFEELFHGTINGASVYPRIVLQRSLSHNAAAVILAHNHPSGIAEPSTADQQITDQLCNVLAMVDIRVLDHFVIGEAEAVSFAERGLL
ncbi:MAG: JAB domain-containing protein [Gammaproteobacteria bacterium]|nr:JAB domain-containing protein [Gammaproteobacteria bacterium]